MILNANSYNDTKTRCVLIWENPTDLTSEFASCDINFALDSYKFLYMLFRPNTDSLSEFGVYISTDSYLEQELTAFDNNLIYIRRITASVDNMHFSEGTKRTFSNDGSASSVTDNTAIIPCYIYGLY